MDFSDFSVDGDEWIYNGSSRQITVNGVYAGDKLTYTSSNGDVLAERYVTADGIVDGPEFLNVSASDTITVTVTRGDMTKSAKAIMTIKPASLTISTPSDSKVYDGTALTAGPATLKGLQGSDVDEVTATAVGTITNVGQTTNGANIDWGNALSSNYEISTNYGTLTVTPQTINPDDPDNPGSYGEVEVSYPQDVPYNGTDQTWAPTVTDGDKVLVAGADYEVSYSTSDRTNVTGTIKVTITGEGNYTGSVERYYQITPLTITVTPRDIRKTQGQADPALTSDYSGYLRGETAGWTGALTREPGEAVGTYTISQGSLQLADNPDGNFLAQNYILVVNEGTFTIVAAPGSGTPTPTPGGGGDGTPTPGTPATVTPADDTTTDEAAPEETIADDDTPLAAGAKDEDCWVHWLILLGMILSAVYFVGVGVRRRKFTSSLLGYEDKVLGNDRDNA